MKAGYVEREVRRLAGRAVHRYGMIREGDRILAAVSGGKDSLTMLWYLTERAPRVPISYQVVPVYLEMGFNPQAPAVMERYFRSLGLDYRIEETLFGLKAHGPENRENPCFFCSRRRRKRLFELAQELKCNKIALGHNQDDLIETLFINMFYGAEISTMKPLQPFFGGRFTVIRPLALVPASTINRLASRLGLPCLENRCPSASNSKRTEIRRMLEEVYRRNSKVRGNIFHALQNVNPEYLL